MSFNAGAWSDDEDQATPPPVSAAAPTKTKGKKKVTLNVGEPTKSVMGAVVAGGDSAMGEEEAPAAAAAPAKKMRLVRRAGMGAGGAAAPAAKKGKKRALDEDEGVDAPASSAAKPAPRGAKRFRDNEGNARDPPPAPPAPPGVGRFHTVLDKEFSDVALPRPGADPSVKSGAWIGAVCRCLQCEATRAAQTLVAGVAEGKGAKTTVVLVDLDNYGYPQWVRHPAPASVAEAGSAPNNVFVWCFYGLGFETHGHKGDPSDAVAAKSLFGSLKRSGQIQFSPCGNFPQAADQALQAVVAILRNMHLALVTSDKGLIKGCHDAFRAQPLLPGRKKKLFQTIDPKKHHHDSTSTWHEIASFISAAEARDAEA